MSTFSFKVHDSHAEVFYGGIFIGIVQNNPAYLGGGLNFTQRISIENVGLSDEMTEKMWDQFYDSVSV